MSRPSTALTAVVGAAVGWLVVVPLVVVALRSVGVLSGDGFTSTHLARAVIGVDGLTSVWNTFVFAGGSTVLATAVAAYLAWLTERTDVPFRRVIYLLVLVPVVVPGILTTSAWILILNDRIGIANAVLTSVLPGTGFAFDAYTMPSMIWVDAIDSLTLPFFIIAAGLRTMDHRLDEASLASGASRTATLRRITLPLMAPAIRTALLLTLLRTIGTFAVPVAMGVPGGIRVLATDVYLASRTSPRDLELGAAYAMLHVVIALVLLGFYRRSLAGEGRFAVVTGKGAARGRIPLGRSRRWHAAAALGLLGVATVLPLMVMVWGSLIPFYQRPTLASFATLDLRHYRWAFASTLVRRAVRNTVAVGSLAAVTTVLFAAVIAQGSRRGGRLQRGVDALATVPIALPGTVLGLALMLVYLRVPLPIYATRWILVIAFITAFLPYAVRAVAAALAQLGVELEDASATSGATPGQTLVRIVLPLLVPTLVVTSLYVFIRTVKSLALPAILAGPGGEMLAVLIYDLLASGQYPRLNAIGVLMVLALLALSLLAAGLTRLQRGRRPVVTPTRDLERAA